MQDDLLNLYDEKASFSSLTSSVQKNIETKYEISDEKITVYTPKEMKPCVEVIAWFPGYDLSLLVEEQETKPETLEMDKLYLKAIDGFIAYTVSTLKGVLVKTKIPAPELFTLPNLALLKEDLLDVTSKAGHTRRLPKAPNLGHVALRTYLEDEKGEPIPKSGIYASLWPENSLLYPFKKNVCAELDRPENSHVNHRSSRDHLHSKDEDDLLYSVEEAPGKHVVKLYGLNIEKIAQKFSEFKTCNYSVFIVSPDEKITRESMKNNLIFLQEQKEDRVIALWKESNTLHKKELDIKSTKINAEIFQKIKLDQSLLKIKITEDDIIENIILLCDIPSFSWSVLGSMIILFEDNTTKNCAGLCFSLLEAGGLFSKLGYENGKDLYYLPGKGFVGGVSAFAAFTMILVGGAVGGTLTIEMGPGAIAGVVIGSLAGWLGVTIGVRQTVKQICTPTEVYEFAKKLKQVEESLSSSDIPGIRKKIRTEISRLQETTSIISKSAKDKAIHLEAALLRAERVNESKTVGEFLSYSYKGMPTIFEEAHATRRRSLGGIIKIAMPTDTFNNIMGLGKS